MNVFTKKSKNLKLSDPSSPTFSVASRRNGLKRQLSTMSVANSIKSGYRKKSIAYNRYKEKLTGVGMDDQDVKQESNEIL